MRIDELRGRKVLIVGCGSTGASVARHLARAGIPFDACDGAAGGARAALDRALARGVAGTASVGAPRPAPADAPKDAPGNARDDVSGDAGRLAAALASAGFHDSLDAAAGDHDVLVLSPGVPRAHPAVRTAIARGATVVGDVELFAGVAGDAPTVAVTGSNGKSTVVAWLAHALRAAGLDARECGNIGVPALDAVAAATVRTGAGTGPEAAPVWVLELSSYQLESTASLAPLAATVLNVSDDHLDRYDSIEHYAAVKRRVYRGARCRVANADDARTLPGAPATADALLAAGPRSGTEHGMDPGTDPGTEHGTEHGMTSGAGPERAVRWHLSADGASLCRDGAALLPVAALRLPGRHNAANALAALALAEPVLVAAGRDDETTRRALHAGLAAWTGLPHRTELVHEAAGVRWYDDSKGTNVDACAKAIEAMPGPIVLIMGGLAKNADFRPLAAPVRERVRLLVLIGRDRAEIARALDGAAPRREADTLEGAVRIARDVARPGDAVLLSPACASFDMFRNFEERGDRFAAAGEERFADRALLVSVIGLGLFGAVMIASASVAFSADRYGDPFHFVTRQLFFLGIGGAVGVFLYRLPLALWEQYGPYMLIGSLVALALVLIPGIGKEVNGSRRWIDLGIVTVQVSETVKLLIIVYLSGYLVRRGHLVQSTFGGFVRPLVLMGVVCVLLLLEPDFGASVVIVGTALLMLFVAGVRFGQFAALVGVLGSIAAALIALSPYRMRRFASFLDPFSDPFDSGFQLTQSLIAIGSGGPFGVGFGQSVQKLFYLPEAHTDFLFAIIAEELGLVGAVALVSLYGFIVYRCFRLSAEAERQGNRFGGYVALGIGIWIGMQAFINLGVNMGMLPTKGITLPLVSYGGSSAVVFAAAFALLLRVERDVRSARAWPEAGRA